MSTVVGWELYTVVCTCGLLVNTQNGIMTKPPPRLHAIWGKPLTRNWITTWSGLKTVTNEMALHYYDVSLLIMSVHSGRSSSTQILKLKLKFLVPKNYTRDDKLHPKLHTKIKEFPDE